jgi:hypothetical protein
MAPPNDSAKQCEELLHPTRKRKNIGLSSVHDMAFGWASTVKYKRPQSIPTPCSRTFEGPTSKSIELVRDQSSVSNTLSVPPQLKIALKRSFNAYAAEYGTCSSEEQNAEVELGRNAFSKKPKILDKCSVAKSGRAHVVFLIDISSSMNKTLDAVTAKEKRLKQSLVREAQREWVKTLKGSSPRKKRIDAVFDCMVEFVSRQLKDTIEDSSRDVYSVVTFNDQGYVLFGLPPPSLSTFLRTCCFADVLICWPTR